LRPRESVLATEGRAVVDTVEIVNVDLAPAAPG